jgi:hypothetical protein
MIHQSPRVLAAALPRMDPEIRSAVIALWKAGFVGPAVRLCEAHFAALQSDKSAC